MTPELRAILDRVLGILPNIAPELTDELRRELSYYDHPPHSAAFDGTYPLPAPRVARLSLEGPEGRKEPS